MRSPFFACLYQKKMEEKKSLNFSISNEVAQGVYSNLSVVAHSENEFVVDFLRMLPVIQSPNVASRIILTPACAKLLVKALSENIDSYENQFGPIADRGQSRVSIHVKGSQGEA